MDREPGTKRQGRITRLRLVLAGAAVLGAGVAGWALHRAAGGGSAKLSFNQDIQPILSENCYPCHGPDRGARKAGLRLDRA
ncbi:MAG TPA: hypothetical protein VMH85_22600, partial [Terriglobales bacterium]|nr:hypothetical protein [Terriglobales bacterium]